MKPTRRESVVSMLAIVLGAVAAVAGLQSCCSNGGAFHGVVTFVVVDEATGTGVVGATVDVTKSDGTMLRATPYRQPADQTPVGHYMINYGLSGGETVRLSVRAPGFRDYGKDALVIPTVDGCSLGPTVSVPLVRAP